MEFNGSSISLTISRYYIYAYKLYAGIGRSIPLTLTLCKGITSGRKRTDSVRIPQYPIGASAQLYRTEPHFNHKLRERRTRSSRNPHLSDMRSVLRKYNRRHKLILELLKTKDVFLNNSLKIKKIFNLLRRELNFYLKNKINQTNIFLSICTRKTIVILYVHFLS